jgi:hypothetical protein
MIGLIAVWLAAAVAGADDTQAPLSALAPGDVVRVEIAGDRKSLRATVESVTAAEIVLRQGSAEPLRIDVSQLQSLDVARGRRSEWRKGAVIGFVPGFLVTGLILGVVACVDVPDCSFRPGHALVGGVFGGIPTGAVGALIGLAFRTDRWVRVHERKPRVSLLLAPVPQGTRFGLSVSF